MNDTLFLLGSYVPDREFLCRKFSYIFVYALHSSFISEDCVHIHLLGKYNPLLFSEGLNSRERSILESFPFDSLSKNGKKVIFGSL